MKSLNLLGIFHFLQKIIKIKQMFVFGIDFLFFMGYNLFVNVRRNTKWQKQQWIKH